MSHGQIIRPDAVGITVNMQDGPNAFPAVSTLVGQGGVAVSVFGGMSKLEYVAALIAAGAPGNGSFEREEAEIRTAKFCVDRAEAILAECASRHQQHEEHNGSGS